jgi:hypothetical protein
MVLVSGYPIAKKILFINCTGNYAWIFVNKDGHAVNAQGEPDVNAHREWQKEQKAGLVKVPRLYGEVLTAEHYRELGIGFVAAYSLWNQEAHVFMPSALNKLEALMANADEIVGFSSFRFDDNLLAAHGLRLTTTYDFAFEARRMVTYPFKGGWGDSLNNYAELNFGLARPAKSSGFGYLNQLSRRKSKRRIGLREFVIDSSVSDIMALVKLYLQRHMIYVPYYTDSQGKPILVTLPETAQVTHDEVRKVDSGELSEWYSGAAHW